MALPWVETATLRHQRHARSISVHMTACGPSGLCEWLCPSLQECLTLVEMLYPPAAGWLGSLYPDRRAHVLISAFCHCDTIPETNNFQGRKAGLAHDQRANAIPFHSCFGTVEDRHLTGKDGAEGTAHSQQPGSKEKGREERGREEKKRRQRSESSVSSSP